MQIHLRVGTHCWRKEYANVTTWSFQLEKPGIEPGAFCKRGRCSMIEPRPLLNSSSSSQMWNNHENNWEGAFSVITAWKEGHSGEKMLRDCIRLLAFGMQIEEGIDLWVFGVVTHTRYLHKSHLRCCVQIASWGFCITLSRVLQNCFPVFRRENWWETPVWGESCYLSSLFYYFWDNLITQQAKPSPGRLWKFSGSAKETHFKLSKQNGRKPDAGRFELLATFCLANWEGSWRLKDCNSLGGYAVACRRSQVKSS